MVIYIGVHWKNHLELKVRDVTRGNITRHWVLDNIDSIINTK